METPVRPDVPAHVGQDRVLRHTSEVLEAATAVLTSLRGGGEITSRSCSGHLLIFKEKFGSLFESWRGKPGKDEGEATFLLLWTYFGGNA